MTNRVRVNSLYTYDPVPLDVIDSKTDLKPGTVVKVIDAVGCPSANVMGHCYVGDRQTGKFFGMVCTDSLVPLRKRRVP